MNEERTIEEIELSEEDKNELLRIERKQNQSQSSRETWYIQPDYFNSIIVKYYEASETIEKFEAEHVADGEKNYKATKEYKELAKIQKKALDECGVCLYKMVRGLSSNGKFSGYTNNWKDDMVADAMMQATRALVGRKFDPTKGFKAFSYFNMICWREFINRIKMEKKKVEMHNKYIEEHAHDYAEESDAPIYVKPSFNSQLKDFWNVEEEANYNSQSERVKNDSSEL